VTLAPRLNSTAGASIYHGSLSHERRRALHLLAGHSDDCDEEVLLANGVTMGQLARLVFDGFATVRATLVPFNGREKSIVG
jgi:hypothetical protein